MGFQKSLGSTFVKQKYNKKRPFKYVSPPSDRVPEMRAPVGNINLKMNYNIEAHIFYQPS